jgi:hypothetical protein
MCSDLERSRSRLAPWWLYEPLPVDEAEIAGLAQLSRSRGRRVDEAMPRVMRRAPAWPSCNDAAMVPNGMAQLGRRAGGGAR